MKFEEGETYRNTVTGEIMFIVGINSETVNSIHLAAFEVDSKGKMIKPFDVSMTKEAMADWVPHEFT